MDALMLVSLSFGLVAAIVSAYSVILGLRAIGQVGGFVGTSVKYGYIGVLFVLAPLVLFVWADLTGNLVNYTRHLLALSGISLAFASAFWLLCAKELEKFAGVIQADTGK